jgi:hypothetical protein
MSVHFPEGGPGADCEDRVPPHFEFKSLAGRLLVGAPVQARGNRGKPALRVRARAGSANDAPDALGREELGDGMVCAKTAKSRVVSAWFPCSAASRRCISGGAHVASRHLNSYIGSPATDAPVLESPASSRGG